MKTAFWFLISDPQEETRNRIMIVTYFGVCKNENIYKDLNSNTLFNSRFNM